MQTSRVTLRVGVGQFDARSGDLAFNLGRHAERIAEAAERGVDLVVFPELSSCGYASDVLDRAPRECALDLEGPELAAVREACVEGSVAAVVGACLPTEGGMTLSSIVIDRQGEVCTRYDKQHLDSQERKWFVPGEKDCLISIDGWRLGLGICYDSSFPEHARAVACRGADGYLVSGAFPVGESARRRAIYLPARALENTVYVVFANYCGAHAGLSYCGQSSVHGPDGRPLAEVGRSGEALVVAELDRQGLLEARRTHPMLCDVEVDSASQPVLVR